MEGAEARGVEAGLAGSVDSEEAGRRPQSRTRRTPSTTIAKAHVNRARNASRGADAAGASEATTLSGDEVAEPICGAQPPKGANKLQSAASAINGTSDDGKKRTIRAEAREANKPTATSTGSAVEAKPPQREVVKARPHGREDKVTANPELPVSFEGRATSGGVEAATIIKGNTTEGLPDRAE